ncbi:MAG: hypothetical protein SFZ03_04815 [Candidatus Melainabacteria bacterium]|nr:hypothetical protein [Candidatus Melainabacteria bacterium]
MEAQPYYLRLKNNPLVIHQFQYRNEPFGGFDAEYYEQVMGELPAGAVFEDNSSQLIQELQLAYDSLPEAVQADFYPIRSAVHAALTRGHVALARLIVERTPVDASLESVKQQLLGLFSA